LHKLTSIYCTVQVFVVIHICDSMWSFSVETNLYILFVYICVAVGDSVINRGGLGFH